MYKCLWFWNSTRLLTEFINLDRENGASAVHHVPVRFHLFFEMFLLKSLLFFVVSDGVEYNPEPIPPTVSPGVAASCGKIIKLF